MDGMDLNIGNICRGAVAERFERACAEIMKNIKDPNTAAEAKRKMTMTFTFVPFKDRTGAQVSFSIDTRMPGAEPVEGTVFIMQSQNGVVRGFAKDPRQDALFTEATQGGVS